MRLSPRIGSVAFIRCSSFFAIGTDQGSIAYGDSQRATYGATSLSVTGCDDARLLAAATSSARAAVRRIDSSLVSLDAAKPQPLPTSTRTPMARARRGGCGGALRRGGAGGDAGADYGSGGRRPQAPPLADAKRKGGDLRRRTPN